VTAAQFSLAHLTVLGVSPLDQIDIAAEAGYDFVGLRTTAVAAGERVASLVGDEEMVGRVQARLADTDVAVLDVELARLGPEDDPDELRGLLEAAAAVGARHVVGQLPDPDRGRAIDHFGRLCDLAGDFGLTVDLEFPSWMETGNLGSAAAVVEAADRPNAGILVDALHFYRSGSSLNDVAMLPAEWFRFVQLCDAPAAVPPTDDEVIHDARAARSLPGYGQLPLTELIESLPVVPYSLEVPNDVLRNELGTAEFARLVLTTARELLADCGLATLGRAT
jgi:sugar phosphate isomerase/epimerase